MLYLECISGCVYNLQVKTFLEVIKLFVQYCKESESGVLAEML